MSLSMTTGSCEANTAKRFVVDIVLLGELA